MVGGTLYLSVVVGGTLYLSLVVEGTLYLSLVVGCPVPVSGCRVHCTCL